MLNYCQDCKLKIPTNMVKLLVMLVIFFISYIRMFRWSYDTSTAQLIIYSFPVSFSFYPVRPELSEPHMNTNPTPAKAIPAEMWCTDFYRHKMTDGLYMGAMFETVVPAFVTTSNYFYRFGSKACYVNHKEQCTSCTSWPTPWRWVLYSRNK